LNDVAELEHGRDRHHRRVVAASVGSERVVRDAAVEADRLERQAVVALAETKDTALRLKREGGQAVTLTHTDDLPDKR
jgi:hypothetical protein